jgi:hypothetical protein
MYLWWYLSRKVNTPFQEIKQREALRKHQKILDSFKDLPKALKFKVQTYYKSQLPQVLCMYCYKLSYPVLSHYVDCYICCSCEVGLEPESP